METMKTMSYEAAKQTRDMLERMVSDASAALRRFPRRPDGLTPDHVKADPAWREARTRYDIAMRALQRHNQMMVKRFRREMREDRRQKETTPMTEQIFGYDWQEIQRAQQGGRLHRPIRAKKGDYGADPIGDGTFRMIPSGDIVDYAERCRRLSKA